MKGDTWPHYLLQPGASQQEQPGLFCSGFPGSEVIPYIHLKVHAMKTKTKTKTVVTRENSESY